ncbi:Putative protein FAR1-RELATED SEQUENCE 10 [Striga hermonthica]|uniref:Protein FAR1-RELATED SEQUENCE n=1 Tax=Striga hermonthica TaxID=68872 RepID=A0A9N7RLX9_STRHE|nr:Putative protein FAR1-RELATED SEQUENCE 10 [Striga hermonthica]
MAVKPLHNIWIKRQQCPLEIGSFSNVRSHELLEDEQVRLLLAYRKIEGADQERILLLSRAGFPVNRIVKVIELEKGVQPGQLPFIEKDVRSFLSCCRKIVEENDVILNSKRTNDLIELLDACKVAAERDEGFVYDFTADESGKVENVAWAYGDSARAFFLSLDDTSKSFSWALQVFVGFMKGRQPEIVVTDMESDLRDALAI